MPIIPDECQLFQMNTMHKNGPINVGRSGSLLKSCWTNRRLIYQLSVREIEARYRGTMLGVTWAVLVPIIMLAMYTFVFSVVFQARWGAQVDNKASFALILFSGLIIYTIFAEAVNRAPGLMLENASYIKKIVFPLEALPWVSVTVACFNGCISSLVLLFFYLLTLGLPPVTSLLIPLAVLPPIFITLGLVFFLSSLGVYLRDMHQLIAVATSLILFLSPVFYPLSSIPEKIRPFLYLNPLTISLQQSRNLLFWGESITGVDVLYYFGYLLASLLIAHSGFWWFQRTKRGFADVI